MTMTLAMWGICRCGHEIDHHDGGDNCRFEDCGCMRFVEEAEEDKI